MHPVDTQCRQGPHAAQQVVLASDDIQQVVATSSGVEPATAARWLRRSAISAGSSVSEVKMVSEIVGLFPVETPVF